jgi:Icc-related predicted phosphoesterase
MANIKLKSIVSEIVKEIVNQHPEHKKINDKLMQIAKRDLEDKGEKSKDVFKEGEEKEYVVTFWVMNNDDKDDYDETVKASSSEEAIEKVKKGAPRLARNFTAKLK